MVRNKRTILKEAKERLAGCTCKTCKYFTNATSKLRLLMGWRQDGGVCSKKHKDWMDYYVAQSSASDSENDYCLTYCGR